MNHRSKSISGQNHVLDVGGGNHISVTHLIHVGYTPVSLQLNHVQVVSLIQEFLLKIFVTVGASYPECDVHTTSVLLVYHTAGQRKIQYTIQYNIKCHVGW